MQDHLPLRKKSLLRQPFVTRCLDIMMITVVQENPGNNKDLEDVHVLHEGQADIQMSCNHILRQFWPVIKFSSYN